MRCSLYCAKRVAIWAIGKCFTHVHTQQESYCRDLVVGGWVGGWSDVSVSVAGDYHAFVQSEGTCSSLGLVVSSKPATYDLHVYLGC